MNASFQGGIVRKSERRRMVGRAWRLDELPLNILQAPDGGIGEYIEGRRGEIEVIGLASTTAIEDNDSNGLSAIRSADLLAADGVQVRIHNSVSGRKRVEELPPNGNHVVGTNTVLAAGTQSDIIKGAIARVGLAVAGRFAGGGGRLRRGVGSGGGGRLNHRWGCRGPRGDIDRNIEDNIATSGGNCRGGGSRRRGKGILLQASFFPSPPAGNWVTVGLTGNMVVACCQRRVASVKAVRGGEGRNR